MDDNKETTKSGDSFAPSFRKLAKSIKWKRTHRISAVASLSLYPSRVSSQWNVLPVFHEVAALESRPSSLNIRPPAPTPALQVSGCVEELLRCNKRLQIGWKSSREKKKNRLLVCCASILTIDRFGHPLSNNRKSDTSKTYRNFRSTKKKRGKKKSSKKFFDLLMMINLFLLVSLSWTSDGTNCFGFVIPRGDQRDQIQSKIPMEILYYLWQQEDH